MADLVPVTHLALDIPEPGNGWPAELASRGIPVVDDDIGRPAIAIGAARDLVAEHRENEAIKARHRVEMERQAVEADRRFRASLPAGIGPDSVPIGVSPAELMMLSDPLDQSARRQSVLEHALEHQDGAVVFHSVAAPTGGPS